MKNPIRTTKDCTSSGNHIVKSYNNFAQSLNLWGHGPLNIDNYEDLLSPVSGEIISNSILESCWTESEKRGE